MSQHFSRTAQATPSPPQNRGQAKSATPDDAWWRGGVVYQIYPRSFMDSNGDGIGDLQGILARLDYVAALGVDAVWLSPFFRSPMADFGYDISDFTDVDPIFGTLDDFDRILEKAHELGLKVVIDQVYSHSSIAHPWFQESRTSRTNRRADWYVWADPRPDGSPPNNWQSLFGGPAWTWDARRKQYYLHNFLSRQPDLNVRNPDVQEALLATARFWLDRGVDGFRLDATNFYMHDPALTDNPPHPAPQGATRSCDFQLHVHNRSQDDNFAFIQRLRDLLDSYGARFSVAEIGDNSPVEEVASFTDGPDKLHTAYSFVFLESDRISPAIVRKAVEDWEAATRIGWPSWTFGNHDAPRPLTRWSNADDPHFAAMLIALVLSLKGTPFLYQGEELGLPQAHVPYERLTDPEAIANWPETLGRDGCRTPFPWSGEAPHGGFSSATPWLPMDPAHLPLAADRQEADPASTLNFTRCFLRYRAGQKALRHGDIIFADTPMNAAPDAVVAFERRAEGESLLCLFNMDSAPCTVPLPDGTWTLETQTGLQGRIEAGGHATLPAYGGLIARKS
ncbi:alpha-glucosidase [Yunchengibacter salinarum]|uniref:alpha-glucosidase n=1 Tax=Yunchengibacter salinarum TaxID=3133399 RepID=UPI0035B5E144